MAFRPSDPSGSCLRHNGAGNPFEELTCLYPSLGRTYTSFEKNFDPAEIHEWMKGHPLVPLTTVLFYLSAVGWAKLYFKYRPALNWRGALAAWNISMAIFSAVGCFRSWPALLHLLYNYSLREIICMDPASSYGSGSTGLWMLLFALSKFAELVDTIFLVVHKKTLLYLHLFHHSAILLGSWHSYTTNDPNGIFIVCLNYPVQSIMYLYYVMTILFGGGTTNPTRSVIPFFTPLLLTSLQILQMVIAYIFVCVSLYVYVTTEWASPNACHVKPRHFMVAFPLGGMFLFMFVRFFVIRYILRKRQFRREQSWQQQRRLSRQQERRQRQQQQDIIMTNGNGGTKEE